MVSSCPMSSVLHESYSQRVNFLNVLYDSSQPRCPLAQCPLSSSPGFGLCPDIDFQFFVLISNVLLCPLVLQPRCPLAQCPLSSMSLIGQGSSCPNVLYDYSQPWCPLAQCPLSSSPGFSSVPKYFSSSFVLLSNVPCRPMSSFVH